MIPAPLQPWPPCEVCDGYGRLFRGRGPTCNACNGSGALNLLCPLCSSAIPEWRVERGPDGLRFWARCHGVETGGVLLAWEEAVSLGRREVGRLVRERIGKALEQRTVASGG